MDAMTLIMRMFGSKENFERQFQNFTNRATNIDPRQEVQQLLNSGKMSQSQFNFWRGIANLITGRNM